MSENNPECAICHNNVNGVINYLPKHVVRNLKGYDKHEVVEGTVPVCTECKLWYESLD